MIDGNLYSEFEIDLSYRHIMWDKIHIGKEEKRVMWGIIIIGAICSVIEKGRLNQLRNENLEMERRTKIKYKICCSFADSELMEKLKKEIRSAYNLKVMYDRNIKEMIKANGGRPVEDGVTEIEEKFYGVIYRYKIYGEEESYNEIWERIEQYKKDSGKIQYNKTLWDNVGISRLQANEEGSDYKTNEKNLELTLSLLMNTYGKLTKEDASEVYYSGNPLPEFMKET